MNLDAPNKNEKQMRETVRRYESPFNPPDWEAMKTKLAKPHAQPKIGNGNQDGMVAPGTSLIFKLLISISIISVASLALWLGSSFFSKTNSSDINNNNTNPPYDKTSTFNNNQPVEKETSQILLEKGLKKQSTEKYLEANRATNSTELISENAKEKDHSLNQASMADLISGNKKTTQNSAQSNERSNAVVGSDATDLSSTKKTDFLKSNTNNLPEGAGNISTLNEKETSSIYQREKGIASNVEEIKNSESGQDILLPIDLSEKETTDLEKREDIPSTSSAPFIRKPLSGFDFLSMLDLPLTIFDSTKTEGFPTLDSFSFASNPIEGLKLKRFTLGILTGISYSSFDLTAFYYDPYPALWGLTSEYRLTKTLSIHLDITRRYTFSHNTKHFTSNQTDFDNGGYVTWAFHRKLDKLTFYETPILLSYQFYSTKKIARLLRFKIGVRPSLLFVPELTEGQFTETIGSISSKAPDGWTLPSKREGLKKFDVGLALGLDIFLTRKLYLNLSANIGFVDFTDDTFWNKNSEFNRNSDFQVSLRWDLFNF